MYSGEILRKGIGLSEGGATAADNQLFILSVLLIVVMALEYCLNL